MKVAILLFTFGVSLTQAVVFDCYFSDVTFTNVGTVYTCDKPTIINTGSSLEIRGTHKAGKSNSDVEGLIIGNQPLSEVPNGLKNFFPNLKMFYVKNSNLSSISSSDLQYPELLYFRVYFNKLSKIEGNLFENNPKLIYIDFYFNQIKNVGYDLLTGLNDLELVDFRNNPCIDKLARNSTEI
jgi:Leucine-rich repeat (LRR) protein